jgi:hypothetical protein
MKLGTHMPDGVRGGSLLILRFVRTKVKVTTSKIRTKI